MKKTILILLSLILAFGISDAENKQLQKAREKAHKEKMKQYKKDKWAICGSTKTLELALLEHYDKLNTGGNNASEILGLASRFKSKNVGHQMAINSASITYAQAAGGSVRGRIASDMAGDGVDADKEFDHFFAAYERLVEKEIKGELTESFSVIRCLNPEAPVKDREYEMESYFIVNENAASKARIRAMENALKESEAAQKHAQKISEYVNEAFDIQ